MRPASQLRARLEEEEEQEAKGTKRAAPFWVTRHPGVRGGEAGGGRRNGA